MVVRDDVPHSYARKLDREVVWSTCDLARYGFEVRLQDATLRAPTPVAAESPTTRSPAETAAELAAIDRRPLSLDEVMAEYGLPDAGPVSGSWQSEERRLPRLR